MHQAQAGGGWVINGSRFRFSVKLFQSKKRFQSTVIELSFRPMFLNETNRRDAVIWCPVDHDWCSWLSLYLQFMFFQTALFPHNHSRNVLLPSRFRHSPGLQDKREHLINYISIQQPDRVHAGTDIHWQSFIWADADIWSLRSSVSVHSV